MKKFLSVVIPMYNSEKTIVRCLNSIISIIVQSNLEKRVDIIVVDDGSSDKSYVLACQTIMNFGIVKKQKNKGVGAARNEGIFSSNSDYIWFIDADDYLCNFDLKKLIREIETKNADVVITGYKSLKNNFLEVRYLSKLFLNSYLEISNNFSDIFSKIIFNVPWNKIYKLSVIKENDISFGHFKSGEDAIFNYFFFEHVKSLYVSDIVTYMYFFSNHKHLSNDDSDLKNHLIVIKNFKSFSVYMQLEKSNWYYDEKIELFFGFYWIAYLNACTYVEYNRILKSIQKLKISSFNLYNYSKRNRKNLMKLLLLKFPHVAFIFFKLELSN